MDELPPSSALSPDPTLSVVRVTFTYWRIHAPHPLQAFIKRGTVTISILSVRIRAVFILPRVTQLVSGRPQNTTPNCLSCCGVRGESCPSLGLGATTHALRSGPPQPQYPGVCSAGRARPPEKLPHHSLSLSRLLFPYCVGNDRFTRTLSVPVCQVSGHLGPTCGPSPSPLPTRRTRCGLGLWFLHHECCVSWSW